MTTQLDVAATIREAYSGAWNHLNEMVRIIWLPGSLYLALSIASVFVDVEEQRALAVALNLASLFLWPIVAVAWHRFILMGDAPPGRFHFAFGRREARYLVVSVFLTLLFVPGFVLGATPAFMPANMTASLLSFFGALLVLVAIVVGSLLDGGPVMSVVAVGILSLVLIFFAVVNIAVLSVAYRELIGPPGTQAPDTG